MTRATFARIGTTFLLSAACFLSAVCSATHAQVVQLPTFHSFVVSTTVSVPDRGGIVLGGTTNQRASSARRHVIGPDRFLVDSLRNNSGTVSRAHATATIIDLAEWDKAVLAEARRRESQAGTAPDATHRRAAFLSRHVATRSNGSRR